MNASLRLSPAAKLRPIPAPSPLPADPVAAAAEIERRVAEAFAAVFARWPDRFAG